MKKIAMSLLCAGLMVASSAQAQSDESAGGSFGSNFAAGPLFKPAVILGTVVGGLVVAGVANSNGEIVKPTPGPGPGPTPEPECNGSDPLIDGVCFGQSTTTSVTVSGTNTVTFTVPVTVTYLPTIPS